MDIETTHPLYRRHLSDWKFLLAAWQGTQALIDAGALPRHIRESPENHAQRQRQAISFNYSRSIVEIFLHYLFEKPPTRELGRLADDALFHAFMKDIDLLGTDYDLFWHEAQQYASVLGHVGILVTKAPGEARSREDELRAGIHPYLAIYLPTNILDWRHGRDQHHRPRLEYVKLREADGTIRCWTRERWELWERDEQGRYRCVALGANPLGIVPFVWHFNARSADPFIGTSDIQDIARIDVSIMRNISQADEVIDLAAFPMLMMPRPSLGEESVNPAVGPRAVMQFDPTLPHSKPDWLRAEVLEPIDAILRFIALKVGEIYRMTNTRGEALFDSTVVPSGRALQIMFRQLNARLATKAAALDESESACLRLWLAWQKQESLFEQVRLQRPRQFNVENLAEDLANMVTARDLVQSHAFRQAVEKAVVRRILPALSHEQQSRIDHEIEAQA